MKPLTRNKQHGAVSLLTAIILLISITLVVLFTSKTVIMETKMTADDYRTTQAAAAAQAAMDQGMAYFADGGMDQITKASTTPFAVTATVADSVLDYTVPTAAQQPSVGSCSMPATTAFPITLSSGSQTTFAQYYFDNTQCNAPTTSSSMDKGLIVAIGWSDDCTAVRTITQCITNDELPAPGPGGESAPLVARSSAGISGNVTFINRYKNTTMWTGGSVDNTNAAFGTWVAPVGGVTAFSNSAMASMMNDSCPSNGCATGSAILDSNKNGEVGGSVVQNDQTLANQTPDQMFTEFFWGKTRAEVRAKVKADHIYASAADVPANTTGMIWLDSGGQLPNIGTPTKPAIVIANGAVTTSATFYGYLYATGQISMGSSDVIYGSAINEAGGFAGAGHPQIVYVPFKNPNDPSTATGFTPISSARASIAGSWKDW